MRGRILKIEMSDYGNYLGRGAGCFYVFDKNRKKTEYRHFAQEISECILKDGNSVSVDALRDICLFGIDCYIMTRYDRIVGFLVNPEDYYSNAKTRIKQYETYLDKTKTIKIMKTILKAKILGQSKVLQKYDLKTLDYSIIERQIDGVYTENVETARRQLMQIESKYSQYYYKEIFSLFPEKIRPERRMTFPSERLNAVFSFCYHILKMRIYKSIIKSHLDTHIGFLHVLKFGSASLVYDIEELFRPIIDSFLLERRTKWHKKDFVLKTDTTIKLKQYNKRFLLTDYETHGLTEDLFRFFDRYINIKRELGNGKRITVDTLINETCLNFARFLRNETQEFRPITAMVF